MDKDITPNGCWNCKHFFDEDAYGYGICDAFDAVEHCSNEPCHLWKERKVGFSD